MQGHGLSPDLRLRAFRSVIFNLEDQDLRINDPFWRTRDVLPRSRGGACTEGVTTALYAWIYGS